MRLFNPKTPHVRFFSPAHNQRISRYILADDIERQAGGLENSEPMPLALGKEPNPIMLADNFAFGVDHRAYFRRQILAQELGNRDRTDEANPHAVVALVVR